MLWQLGGKGANLAEMASIGLSVPPGFTITTDTCHEYNQNGNKLPEGLWEEVMKAFRTLEEDMGASLGDPLKPLLVSVRSGAAVRRISFCALDCRFFNLVRIISLM
jgi:pyruvate,orthophosphate dikinase